MPQVFESAKFQIDHIVAEQHGGQTVLENLSLACIRCNLHKEPNIAGHDPVTGTLVPFFHPRRQRWSEHLALEGSLIVGLTPVGRASVVVLAMNRIDAVVARQALLEEGLVPPSASR